MQKSIPLPANLRWRAVAERTVGAIFIEIALPATKLAVRVSEGEEYAGIQTFVSQPGVEGLNEAIFDRFAGSDEVQLYARESIGGLARQLYREGLALSRRRLIEVKLYTFGEILVGISDRRQRSLQRWHKTLNIP